MKIEKIGKNKVIIKADNLRKNKLIKKEIGHINCISGKKVIRVLEIEQVEI